jgi:hypothetical protein
MRARECSPYPELFSQPDESKRVEKMLELTLSQVFSGLDENPTNLAPTIDKTHKSKSKASWRVIIQRYLDTPTTIKAYVQHIFKIPRSGKTTRKD